MKKGSLLMLIFLIMMGYQDVTAESGCDTLDEAEIEEIETIAALISEEGIDEFEDRLNDKVLVSQEALAAELGLVEDFVCMDMSGGGYHYDQYPVMEVYLSMLEYYQAAMGNDEVARVGAISYEPIDAPRAFRLTTVLEKRSLPAGIEEVMSEEQYRDDYLGSGVPPFDEDYRLMDVIYFSSSDADIWYDVWESEKQEEETKNTSPDMMQFVESEIIDRMMNALDNPLANATDRIAEFFIEEEMEREIVNRESRIASSFLDMDLAIYETSEIQGQEDSDAQVYPRTSTFSILERWEDVHEINPDVPYPEESIRKQDWYGIGEYSRKNQKALYDIDDDLYEYISHGELPQGRTVEDLATGNE